MKHFIVKLNGIRCGEGVELKNGSAIVEFDGASGSIQYVTLDAFKKSHAKTAQEDCILDIEWTEIDTDTKLAELIKLVQQISLTMPKNYTYTYNRTVTLDTNTNEEAIKRNTIAALASALKNVSKLQFYPGVGGVGPNWLAAELYEQGIIASNKCMTDE